MSGCTRIVGAPIRRASSTGSTTARSSVRRKRSERHSKPRLANDRRRIGGIRPVLCTERPSIVMDTALPCSVELQHT